MIDRKKYRKKPITIEAVQYDGTNAIAIWGWMKSPQFADGDYGKDFLYIQTLEGIMRADRGATNFELMQISYQYPARIHTLRHKLGHEISNIHVKDKMWQITLVKDADVLDPEPTPSAFPQDPGQQTELIASEQTKQQPKRQIW